MNTRTYAITSSVIFFLVALVHVFRLVLKWDVMIDGWYVPAWASVIGVLVAGFLSFEGLRLFRQGRCFPGFDELLPRCSAQAKRPITAPVLLPR